MGQGASKDEAWKQERVGVHPDLLQTSRTSSRNTVPQQPTPAPTQTPQENNNNNNNNTPAATESVKAEEEVPLPPPPPPSSPLSSKTTATETQDDEDRAFLQKLKKETAYLEELQTQIGTLSKEYQRYAPNTCVQSAR